MELDDLVLELEDKRNQFNVVVNQVLSGNEQVASMLPFSQRNKDLFLVNARMMGKSPNRRSGRLGMTHPTSAAYLAGLMIPDAPYLERAQAIALSHDTLEDGCNYDPTTYDLEWQRASGDRFKDAKNASILLTNVINDKFEGFDLYHFHNKVATPYMVKTYGSNVHATALIAEKLDNMLDNSESGKPYGSNPLGAIATVYYSALELHDITPKLAEISIGLCAQAIEKYGIENSYVARKIQEWQKIRDDQLKGKTDSLLLRAIHWHLKKYGFVQSTIH